MKNEQYFVRWKQEMSAYLKAHQLNNALDIYHIPKETDEQGKEEYKDKKPFIRIAKENDAYYFQFYSQEGNLEEKSLITAESLTKEHELASFLLKRVTEDNNKKKVRNRALRNIGLTLLAALGVSITSGILLLTGFVSLPFILFNPLVFPLLLIAGFTAVTAGITYKTVNYLFTPKEEVLLPFNDIDTLEVPKEVYKKRWWQYLLMPIRLINGIGKWFARLIVNNVIFKYTVGNIIAAIGNSGQDHYKVEPQDLTGILSALIFAGGTHKINIEKDGHLNLGPTLSEQYREFKKFQTSYEQQHFSDKHHVKVNDSTILTYYKANNYNQPDITDPVDNSKKKLTIYFCGNSSGGPQLAETVVNDLNEFAKPIPALDEEAKNAIRARASSSEEAEAFIKQFNKRTKAKAMEGIIVSYPGVFNSSGSVTEAPDLLKSMIAMINDLLEKGYKLENINLDSMSLGGAIAIQLAEHFHSRGGKFRGVFASRTFASTLAIGMSYVSKVPYVGGFLKIVLAPFILFGLWAVNWNMFSGLKFWALDSNRVWSNTVHSPSKVRQYFADNQADETLGLLKDDDILPTLNGGLYTAPMTRVKRTSDRLGAYFTDKISSWKTGEETHAAMNKFKLLNVAHKTIVGTKAEEENTFSHATHIDGHSQVAHGTSEKSTYFLLSRTFENSFHPRAEATAFETKIPDGADTKYSREKCFHRGNADKQRLRFLRCGGVKFNQEMDSIAELASRPASATAA